MNTDATGRPRPKAGSAGRSTSPRGKAAPVAKTPRRRGRPPGTVSLTPEIAKTIITRIRGGGFDYVAAESAGVSVRTFADWMARGEDRHPTRPPTPMLRAFARDVRTAKAMARLGAEIREYQEHPRQWLSWAARSRPDREGWTELPRAAGASAAADLEAVSEQEWSELISGLLAEMLGSGELVVPACSHPRCRCPYHRTRARGGRP